MLTTSSDNRLQWPSMWWWAILALILVFGGAVRYIGYNFSLPYIEHLDEPALTTAADSILRVGTAAPIHHFDAYPPGIVTLDYFLLRWFHDPAEPPTTVIPTVRLMSIAASLGIAILIAFMGYRTAGSLAGLVSAGLWSVGTLIVESNRFATADSFLVLVSILAILLTCLGVIHSCSRWLTLGTICLIVAIMFKYQAIFWAPLVFLMPLWRLRTSKPEERRAILVNYVDNAIIFAVFLFWLIGLSPALGIRHTSDFDQAYTQHLGLPSFLTLYRTIQTLLGGYTPLVSIPGLVGLGLYFWSPLRKRLSSIDFIFVLAGAALWIVGISFFSVQAIRQSMAAVALLAVLIAVGLSGWASALQWLCQRISASILPSRHPWVAEAIVAGLVLVGSLPQITGSIANAREHTLPDRRNDLALWFENTLDPGLYIADRANHKTFDRYWGGYAGQKHFPLFATELVTQRPLEEWQANNVLYAIVPYDVYQHMEDTAEGQTYLDQMVLLKSYPPDPSYRGPSMVVLRIYPIQHPLTGSLGPIQLLGYDIDRSIVSPGGSFTIRYYWRASQPTDSPYQAFNHLMPLDSFDLVAQVDGAPLSLGRPTTSWNDPTEVILSQPFTITIGEDIPPGKYRFVTGFYRLDNGQRLTTPTGDSFLTIASIQVSNR